jgi:hypothetical protein
LFPAGEYRLGRTVELVPDRHYVGEAGAVLRWTGAETAGESKKEPRGRPALRLADTTGGRIERLVFVGGGLAVEGASRNLSIDDCLFQDIPAGNALSIAQPSSGITISHNSFRRIGMVAGAVPENGREEAGDPDRPAAIHSAAIHAVDPDRMIIMGNHFDTVRQAIALSWNRLAGRDVLVTDNHGQRVLRAGIEASGTAPVNGLLVRGNIFTDFLPNVAGGVGPGSVGLSIRLAAGRGIRILDNQVVADAPAAGRYGAGIAIDGGQAIVEGNRVDGNWEAGILLDRAPGTLVAGNRLCRPGADTIVVRWSDPVFLGGNSIVPDCP